MVHLSGIVHGSQLERGIDEDWWNLENLVKPEQATKARRARRSSLGAASDEPWLGCTVEIFQYLDSSAELLAPASSRILLPPTLMTLRDRKSQSPTPSPSAAPRPAARRKSRASEPITAPALSSSTKSDNSLSSSSSAVVSKKLCRVFLRLDPDPTLSSNP